MNGVQIGIAMTKETGRYGVGLGTLPLMPYAWPAWLAAELLSYIGTPPAGFDVCQNQIIYPVPPVGMGSSGTKLGSTKSIWNFLSPNGMQ